MSLKVYDLIGREVATLVSEEMKVGNYEATFDASSIPSGVYFYKLTAAGTAVDFVQTKKMMLVK